jgi:hypothetical protein
MRMPRKIREKEIQEEKNKGIRKRLRAWQQVAIVYKFAGSLNEVNPKGEGAIKISRFLSTSKDSSYLLRESVLRYAFLARRAFKHLR